jgi:hypothetical protein
LFYHEDHLAHIQPGFPFRLKPHLISAM